MPIVPFFMIDEAAAREGYERSVRQAGAREGDVLFDMYCVDPRCDCTDAHLVVMDAEDLWRGETPPPYAAIRRRAEEAWQGRRSCLQFILDQGKGRVLPPQGFETDARLLEIAARFDRALRDDDRARFAARAKLAKTWGEQNAWRYEDWTETALEAMLPWCAIFPAAEPLRFEGDGRDYLCEEQYCGAPGCACPHVMLQFFELVPGKKRAPEVSAVRLDLTRHPPQIDEIVAGRPAEARRMLALLVAAHPDVYARLRRRRAFMRKEFAPLVKKQLREIRASEETEPRAQDQAAGRRREGSPAPPPASTGWIRRNAPCPCGSGLKYKNCCGRRA